MLLKYDPHNLEFDVIEVSFPRTGSENGSKKFQGETIGGCGNSAIDTDFLMRLCRVKQLMQTQPHRTFSD